MSYILDALRKAEIERQANQEAPLQRRLLPNQPAAQKRQVGLVILLLLNTCLLIYLAGRGLMTEDSSRRPDKPLPVVQVEKTVPVAPVAQVGQVEQLDKVTVNEPVLQMAETLVKPETRGKPLSIAKRIIDQKKAIRNSQPVNRVESVMIDDPDIIVEPDIIAQMESVDEPVKLEVKALTPVIDKPVRLRVQADKKKPDDGIEFLSELPVAYRRGFPTLNINVYGYSEMPEESFIIVDMKKYQSGQRLPSGVLIKAIGKDSLLLEYENQTVRIERPM